MQPKQEQPQQQEAHISAMKSGVCSPQLEKAHMQQQRPSAAKSLYKKSIQILIFQKHANKLQYTDNVFKGTVQ